MDYILGLTRLKQYAQQTGWNQEFLIYEQRLLETLQGERLYGSSNQDKVDRARIVDQLNLLAMKQLGLSFNDLCSEQNQAGFMNEPHTDRPGGSAVAQGPAVCIAYSHEDRSYLDELHAYLTPYARTGEIDFWDDTKIKPGANWQAERASAFRRARIVVLLVSIDFLASDEIAKQILPALLTAAGKQEVQLFSVILRPCSFEQSVLAPFRSFNNSQTPLSGMNRNRREAFWAQLVESIKDSLK